jgi:hypothetical protein
VGEGRDRWVREHCAAHASCPLITSFSLIAQQSHAISSIRRACRVLQRLRPRLPSPLARRSALRCPSVVHTRGMSVLVHAWSRPAFAIIVMPGYISRSLKVSHSSGTKVIELCLEIVDSIPKPLQGIWVHHDSKGTLGFRRWFHHYPSHFLLSLYLPFFVSSRKLWSREIRPFPKKTLGLVTLSGGCGLTRRSGAAKGKGGKPIIKIRKLNLRLLLRRENTVQRTPPRAHLD